MADLRLHGESNVGVFIISVLEKIQSIFFVIKKAEGVIHTSAVEINCRTIVLLEPKKHCYPKPDKGNGVVVLDRTTCDDTSTC